MVHDPITVLVVADGAGDTHPAIQTLAETDPPCVVVRATALEPALHRLSRGGIDTCCSISASPTAWRASFGPPPTYRSR